MKKKIFISLLVCLIIATFSVSAFAMDSYEPNNTASNATYIVPGNSYSANLDPGDIDYFFFSQPTAGTQMVYFIPSDNQTYYVGIYDYHVLGSSATPLVWKVISNSQGTPVLLSFTREANTAYWVSVFGSNNTTTPNYTVLPIQQ